jgi:DNA-3-methyladenine glycosylase
MTIMSLLSQDFFNRDTLEVAKSLLGKKIVSRIDGRITAGYIIEAEAYQGEKDMACHARAGRTSRTQIMYGPPGHAYIYFNYGMHWLFNCVTENEGFPAAVLIRAITPCEGINWIADRRGNQPNHLWCNGPAKLCRALSITGEYNGVALYEKSSPITIEEGLDIRDKDIFKSPRIGISNAPEPWRSIPWRFYTSLS